jgi:NAD(P)-dependent dehydrogenase (short-subunit alcohol dehydrogenase family)
MTSDPRNLGGKVAFVTGGTSGIGRATAIALSEAGAKVAITGRRKQEGEELVSEITKRGGDCLFIRTDVSQAADVEAAVAKTVATFGRIDIAFNNAGVGGAKGGVVDLLESDFDLIFNTNVRGVWLCMKYEIQQMLKQNCGGAIINNSSIQGHISLGFSGHYTASKHAVEGYTKSAAVEYAKHGIRVNAIAPGTVITPLITGYNSALEEHAKRYPIRRLAETDDVVGAVLFLASDAARYISGVSLPVDGGFLIQ